MTGERAMRMVLGALVLLSCPAVGWGAWTSCGTNCYLADTASALDVQSAIDACDAASGGEVRIPAGAVTYTTTTVTKQLAHNLLLRGAGNGVDGTVIRNQMTNQPSIRLTANGSVTLTIRDIRFVSVAGYASGHGQLNIAGSSLSVMLTNLYFDMSGGGSQRAIEWGPGTTGGGGVITYSTFFNPTSGGQGITIYGYTDGMNGYWDGTPTWGTSNAKFIEDCVFDFPLGADSVVEGYAGARVVFRYNDVRGSWVGWHGPDSSTSAHSFEVYNNNFHDASASRSMLSSARGGTALIWGNRLDTTYGDYLVLSLYRACNSQSALGPPRHICDGTSSWDGNAGGGLYGYRCYQQPGTSGANGITQWPLIEWDNIRGGGSTANMRFALNSAFVNPSCGTNPFDSATYLQEKRDYINHGTCVGDGGAFCATWWDDVSKKARNYTPYTYPHPLTQAPASPTHVTVRQ